MWKNAGSVPEVRIMTSVYIFCSDGFGSLDRFCCHLLYNISRMSLLSFLWACSYNQWCPFAGATHKSYSTHKILGRCLYILLRTVLWDGFCEYRNILCPFTRDKWKKYHQLQGVFVSRNILSLRSMLNIFFFNSSVIENKTTKELQGINTVGIVQIYWEMRTLVPQDYSLWCWSGRKSHLSQPWIGNVDTSAFCHSQFKWSPIQIHTSV